MLRALQTNAADTGYVPVRSIAAPPTSPVSVTPVSGTGTAASFLARYAAYGTASLSLAYFLVGTSLTSTENCLVEYNGAANTFRLADNAAFLGPITTGGPNLTNAACTLKGSASASSVAVQIYKFTDVMIPLEFSAGFSGPKTLWMLSYGSDGSNSGWQLIGSFAVSGGVVPPGDPAVVSLTRTGNSFTAVYSHSSGAQRLYLSYMLFLPIPNRVQYTAQGSCLIEYNRISSGMRLINDAGTDWLGGASGIPIGTPGATLTNSACTVDVASATAAIGTSTMSYTTTVTLKNTAMTSIAATFLQALDVTARWTGLTQFGNVSVVNAMGVRPGPVIGTIAGPANPLVSMGPGTTGPLTQLHLRVASKIIGSPACHIVFFYGSNTVNMINDAESALVSPIAIPIGSTGLLGNSRCSINTAQITRNGDAVQFNSLTYNSATFSGTKTLYVQAFDASGYTTHWFGAMDVTIP